MQQTFVITLIILVTVKLLYKELLFYTFDPQGAQACGLPVNWIYFGMISAITLTIVASLQTVGALLVISLLMAGNYGVFVGKRAAFNDGIGSNYWDYS